MKAGMDGINNLINKNMKKILIFLIFSVILASCYEDYIKDFNYTSIYFPYQQNVRTFVVGEGLKIEVGAALGGVMKNNIDRNVNFILDNSLITPQVLASMKIGLSYIKEAVADVSTLLPLPSNYYTLSDPGRMMIKQGQHSGTVVVSVDSAAFLSDPATINASYALPFYISSADADSVIEKKRFSIIGVKYENMLFGNYYHGGVTQEKNPSGNTINTVAYYTTIPQSASNIWTLNTIAPNSLAVKGYSQMASTKEEIVLTLEGNNITISSASGSTFTFENDGTSTFNRSKLLQDRKIFLSYKYVNNEGNTCYAKDTLTFRNRIRDGVNEWQDENPSHYE